MPDTDNYWEYMASFISDDEPMPAPEDMQKLHIHCREVFQYALTLTLSGNDKRALGFYNYFILFFNRLPLSVFTCHDFLRMFISRWIIEGRTDEKLICNAFDAAAEECRRYCRVHRVDELIKILDELDMPGREEFYGGEDFTGNPVNLRHSYEFTGDMLVEWARLCLLSGDRIRAGGIASKALFINGKARILATEDFFLANPSWGLFRNKSNRWINKNHSRLASDFFTKKKDYLGNLELFRQQAMLLSEISRHTPKSFAKDNAKRRFEGFFRENISRKGRLSSQLGLMEEVEWILVRIKMENLMIKYRDLSPSDILRIAGK